MTSVTVVAPTLLEYGAARVAIRGAPIVRSGVGRTERHRRGSIIVCGLAGGLSQDLVPGTAIVATSVAAENGTPIACDSDLVSAIAAGAARLGFDILPVKLLTSDHLVRGVEREVWADRGFGAVDMETAQWMGENLRATSVRVVLDGAANEISDQWLNPRGAIMRPALWRELGWLATHAPSYALRAARIVAASLDVLKQQQRPARFGP